MMLNLLSRAIWKTFRRIGWSSAPELLRGCDGNAGQGALVLTYCAAQSPHDQYYLGKREAMVSGIVRPPAIDLANRDLIEAHLHAVWLAERDSNSRYGLPMVLSSQSKSRSV